MQRTKISVYGIMLRRQASLTYLSVRTPSSKLAMLLFYINNVILSTEYVKLGVIFSQKRVKFSCAENVGLEINKKIPRVPYTVQKSAKAVQFT